MCFPGNVADCQFCLSLLVQRPCMLNWDFLHYKYNSKLSYYKYEFRVEYICHCLEIGPSGFHALSQN